MKSLKSSVGIVLFLFCFSAVSADKLPPGNAIHLDRVPLITLLNLVIADLSGKAFVVDSAALKTLEDERVTLHIDNVSSARALSLLEGFLLPFNIVIAEQKGIYVIKPDDKRDLFVYKPLYRSAQYLRELGSAVAPDGTFAGRGNGMSLGDITQQKQSSAFSGSGSNSNSSKQQSIAPNDQGNNRQGINAQTEISSDVIVFLGFAKDVKLIQSLFSQIDVKQSQASIKGVVYEVGTNKQSGSAVQLVLKLLGGRVALATGGTTKAGDSVVFSAGDLAGFVSALDSDSRFKVLSQPSVTVASGSTSVLTVGQDVPVVGAIEQSGVGQSRQSIEYRSAGVILSIKPEIRENYIELTVDQQLSDFVRTSTGVDSSPTINRRQVKTTVLSGLDDVVVIGGLRQRKDQSARSGLSFLPSFLRSDSVEADETELVLVLQVTKI